MLIRRETDRDTDVIRAITAAAFARGRPPGQLPPEAKLIDELRAGPAWLPALEQWYLDGGINPIAHYVEEGLRPLRSIWSKPDELAAGDVDERPGGFPKGADGHPELSGLRIYLRPEPEGAAALVRG